MRKATMLTHSDFIFSLTKELHTSGMIQIDPVETEGLEKSVPDRSDIEDYESRLKNIMEIIRYEESEDIMDMIFHPEPPEVFEIPSWTEEELISRTDELLPSIEQEIKKREERLLRLRERKTQLEEQRIELLPFKGMEFDLSYLGEGDYISILAGTTRDLDGLMKVLDSEFVHIYHEGIKGEFSVVIITHRDELPNVERARRQRFFDGLDLGLIMDQDEIRGHPSATLKEIDTELLAISGEMKDIQKEYRSIYKENREELLILNDELEILLERYRIFENYRVTRTTTTLTGWIEQGREEDFETLCNNATNGHISIIFDDPEGNEAPSKLKNPPWAQPFEPLIHMFSTPRYNELDVSMVVGPLFVIFFGLMVGDAGYGLIIIALGLFVIRVHGKFSSEIRDYGYFMMLMGISTLIFGLIMGGVFYDSITRFIYGDENLLLYPELTIFGISLPMDPMNEPTTIFLASLIIGLITLNVGIVLSTYHDYVSGNYFDLITNDFSWFILQPGGILLIGGFMFDAFQLNATTTILAAFMLIVGLVLRLVQSKGLIMFDFTGFVGNVLSFARILALALATAGLALAINYFSQIMGEIHPVLIIVGILLFIIAHFMNTLLQSLGAGIHSLRLQYVEFFSMFYEGGGKKFKPFHIERSYTKVIERRPTNE